MHDTSRNVSIAVGIPSMIVSQAGDILLGNMGLICAAIIATPSVLAGCDRVLFRLTNLIRAIRGKELLPEPVEVKAPAAIDPEAVAQLVGLLREVAMQTRPPSGTIPAVKGEEATVDMPAKVPAK